MIVLCVPMRTNLWARVVSVVDRLALVGLPDTALLALHPFSAIPFMSRDPPLLAEPSPQALSRRPVAAAKSGGGGTGPQGLRDTCQVPTLAHGQDWER